MSRPPQITPIHSLMNPIKKHAPYLTVQLCILVNFKFSIISPYIFSVNRVLLGVEVFITVFTLKTVRRPVCSFI